MANHTPKKRKGPRFSRQFIKRLSSWLVLSTALTIAVRSASTLFWDTDGSATGNSTTGAGLGGTGTWDNTATSDWWLPPNANLQAWNNGGGDTAVFAGVPGTVTVAAGGVSAAGLTFNAAGYTLQGSGTLTVGTGGINVVATASRLATTLNGPMTLSGAQTWTNNSNATLVVGGNVNNNTFALTLASGAGGPGISISPA